MIKHLIFGCFCLFTLSGISQDDKDLYYHDEEETPKKFQPSQEIGFDAIFSASTFGGIAGVGVKYGFVVKENLIVGPSVRYQRNWTKAVSTAVSYTANVYGGGGFLHYRMFNYFFIGTEIEALSSPFNYIAPQNGRVWAMTAFTGGGFSRDFGDWRLNAGIMYDVINSANSPYRYGYVIRNQQGVLQPVIYRLALFFEI